MDPAGSKGKVSQFETFFITRFMGYTVSISIFQSFWKFDDRVESFRSYICQQYRMLITKISAYFGWTIFLALIEMKPYKNGWKCLLIPASVCCRCQLTTVTRSVFCRCWSYAAPYCTLSYGNPDWPTPHNTKLRRTVTKLRCILTALRYWAHLGWGVTQLVCGVAQWLVQSPRHPSLGSAQKKRGKTFPSAAAGDYQYHLKGNKNLFWGSLWCQKGFWSFVLWPTKRSL